MDKVILCLIGIAGFILVILLLFVIMELIRFIIALIRRHFVFSRLKRVAQTSGAIYTRHHLSSSSLIRSYKGEDICIETKQGRKYRIKFFPLFTDAKFVSLYKDERKNAMRVDIVYRMAIGTTYAEGRARMKAPDGEPIVSLNGLTVKRKVNLDFYEDGCDNVQNIIVYSSKSHSISFTDEKNRKNIVDNSVKYTDNSLFYSDKVISRKMQEWLNEEIYK